MKKTLCTLFTVAIVSVSAMAQDTTSVNEMDKKSPEERAERMTERMSKQLVLTPEQKTKVKALILQHERERQEKMKEEKARRDKMDADLKSILSPEQYDKMISLKKERMEQHHGKGTPPMRNK